MSILSEQLPLAIQLRDDATFDNFSVGDNALLLAQLRQQLDGGERYLYVYGVEDSGRSHLLQAACHHAEQLNLVALYLPLLELSEYSPQALFDGLENLDLICLDDVQAVLGQPEWEQALFNLFNRLADQQCRLLISAGVAVRELEVGLADLRSRLSWGTVLQLAHLTEAQQLAVIQQRAGNRGLQLNDEVARFIYHRCQRDLASLLAVIEQLDLASLREQRRLTVPFVKSVMGW